MVFALVVCAIITHPSRDAPRFLSCQTRAPRLLARLFGHYVLVYLQKKHCNCKKQTTFFTRNHARPFWKRMGSFGPEVRTRWHGASRVAWFPFPGATDEAGGGS